MKTVIISILVTLYHFIYRIIIGEATSRIDTNKAINYNSVLLHEFGFEKPIYDLLKVKAWKDKMITAKPYKFDIYKRSLTDILKSMIIAEKVHIICFFLSYLPLFLIIPFDSPLAFIITSFLASIIDIMCVIIQRYNIPRVLNLLDSHSSPIP